MSVGGLSWLLSLSPHRCARGRRMCSYAWIDLRGGCALSSTQGRRPREPSASTGTSFGARDDVELFTTLASVVRSYSHNKVAPIGYYFEPDLWLWELNAFAARFFGVVQFSVDARFGRFLRLVAAWQFGTGVLWASVACVFRQLHTDSATSCPRVACYCAFAAQSGGGGWLAGDGPGAYRCAARALGFAIAPPGIEPVSRVLPLPDGRE